MSKRAATRLAWCLWAITAAVLLLGVPPVNAGDEVTEGLFGALVLLAYATAGALVASRQPRNPIGWLLVASALLSACGDLALKYAVLGLLTRPGVVPAAAWAAVIGGGVRSVGFFLILTFLLLLFPTGHLPSPRWRPQARIAVVAIALFCVANILVSGDLSSDDTRLTSFANPLGLVPAGSVLDNVLSSVSILLIFGCAVGCCASVVARFRRARGVERQQLKWLVYAAVWAALFFFAAWVGVFINNPILASALTFDLCLLGIPVAVAIAILRHGLFDIDLIINRTLVYGSLTLLLAAVYLGSVAAMQALATRLTGRQALPPVAIVASTLLIAALFSPLRRRLQRAIDRRFYRGRYDAAKTLAAFGLMLRTETDLAELQAHVLAAVEETMQPVHLSLWMAPAPARARQEGAR